MRTILEVIRIALIFLILGMLGSSLVVWIYSYSEAKPYTWISSLAILLLLFVLYRNKLQFTGWYKGKAGKKLSKFTTFTIILTSVILLIAPMMLAVITN
ncbi:hypothetical protein [Piscibacillus halophilus]|uniref:Uncharacterized protein n=1 Tax=Piscibacillus halophilus TaxID=571933 RepID=A0A1H9DHT9_9BACI|nr:hypothetical protein [Piscibacillus halophilus]SEQ12308.1 hypothetical protein SAMN05216362_1075 [Piscibacillus halophilus]